jgi:3-dehydroquinate dehydratase type I
MSGTQPIVSYHKFDGALSVSEMEKVLEQEIASGARVCKIVGTAEKIEDNMAVLNFVASHSSMAKLVCFCMGEAGKVSRLLSPMFGAFFTFASLETGNETAAGQMTIGEMRVAYQLLGA